MNVTFNRSTHWVWLIVIPAVFAHCSRGHTVVESSPNNLQRRVEWYLASRQPAIWCPHGRELPMRQGRPADGLQYICLADQSGRFYIPPHDTAARQHALALREASLSSKDKRMRRIQTGTEAAASLLLRLTLSCAAILGQSPDVVGSIWEE